jgi:hypothetical protein
VAGSGGNWGVMIGAAAIVVVIVVILLMFG